MEKIGKTYTLIIAESMFAFYIATFCMIMYFFHRNPSDIFAEVIIVFLYLFVLFICVKRLIQKLPIAMLMILVPIAPLFALIVVVSMIPVLQWLG